jgi:transcriptional regulator with XRE-family HTH domain
MTIGTKLRQRRLSLGYTLDELRELILNQGVTISKASLSKYELDKSVPKATNLYSVAIALNTTPDYFLKKTKKRTLAFDNRLEARISRCKRDLLRI